MQPQLAGGTMIDGRLKTRRSDTVLRYNAAQYNTSALDEHEQ